jgi:hypothetical protein
VILQELSGRYKVQSFGTQQGELVIVVSLLYRAQLFFFTNLMDSLPTRCDTHVDEWKNRWNVKGETPVRFESYGVLMNDIKV